MADRLDQVQFRFAIGEGRRQLHLEAPGQVALPVVVDQMIGGRSQRIRQRVPQVRRARSVAIHRERQIVGRQELRMSHRAGPGADHARGRHVVLGDDVERGQQLRAREGLAVGAIAEVGQRLEHVGIAEIVAEIGLDAPDAHDDVRRHAVVMLDAGQQRLVLGILQLAARHAIVRHRAIQIGPDRRHEFRLLGGAVADLRILLHAGEGDLDHRVRLALAAARRTGTSPPIPDSWRRCSGTWFRSACGNRSACSPPAPRSASPLAVGAALRLGRLRGASRQRHHRAHDHDADGVPQPRPSQIACPHAHTQIQIANRRPRIGRARAVCHGRRAPDVSTDTLLRHVNAQATPPCTR